MGIWATYCCICGAPLGYGGFEWVDKYDKNKNLKFPFESWLNQIGALINSGKFVFGEYDNTGGITAFNTTYNLINYFYKNSFYPVRNEKLGFGMHKICYNLIKNIPNIYDKLSSFKRHPRYSGCLVRLDYKPLTKYYGQFFNDEKLFKSKDIYAIKNPLYNTENMKRIKKNVLIIKNKTINPNNFIIIHPPKTLTSKSPSRNPSRRPSKNPSRSPSGRSKNTRKGPTASATLYSIGTKKKGNDGDMWIIKKNIRNIKRWVKI